MLRLGKNKNIITRKLRELEIVKKKYKHAMCTVQVPDSSKMIKNVKIAINIYSRNHSRAENFMIINSSARFIQSALPHDDIFHNSQFIKIQLLEKIFCILCRKFKIINFIYG